MDANKHMKLTNKGVQRGKVESQGTCPTKVDIFKWLLRSGVNIANIDGSEAKRKKRRKSQETHASRVEIFR